MAQEHIQSNVPIIDLTAISLYMVIRTFTCAPVSSTFSHLQQLPSVCPRSSVFAKCPLCFLVRFGA